MSPVSLGGHVSLTSDWLFAQWVLHLLAYLPVGGTAIRTCPLTHAVTLIYINLYNFVLMFGCTSSHPFYPQHWTDKSLSHQKCFSYKFLFLNSLEMCNLMRWIDWTDSILVSFNVVPAEDWLPFIDTRTAPLPSFFPRSTLPYPGSQEEYEVSSVNGGAWISTPGVLYWPELIFGWKASVVKRTL